MGTKLGNVTMTDDKLIISYSKNVTQQRPSNFIGVDRNLDNVTTCDSQGKYVVHDLSKVQKIITSYSTVKSRFRRNDSRIRQKVTVYLFEVRAWFPKLFDLKNLAVLNMHIKKCVELAFTSKL